MRQLQVSFLLELMRLIKDDTETNGTGHTGENYG